VTYAVLGKKDVTVVARLEPFAGELASLNRFPGE
jgi:hypothetical protein